MSRIYWVDEEMMKEFANLISYQREKQNLTLKEIAENIGCSWFVVSKAENATSEIGFTKMVHILESLGYELSIVPKKRIEQIY